MWLRLNHSPLLGGEGATIRIFTGFCSVLLDLMVARVQRNNLVNCNAFFFYFLFFPLLRGTGFGFCNALCKLSAVLGNLIFGSLVGITKAIPILMASSVLVGGGLVGLRLPDTMANVLM